MGGVDHLWDGDKLVVKLEGLVDTQSAPLIEEQIVALMGERVPKVLCFNCDRLTYIASAGLRMVMRIAKVVPKVCFTEVWPEVYTLFEMTGFDTLFDVSRAMRRISVEGCPVIGRGSKGVVYRISGDTIVKVNEGAGVEALDEISHEREVARAAFIAGVPTAISYDVVRVNDGYGSVFELIGAESLADLLAKGEMSVEEVAARSVSILRDLHNAKADPQLMPDIRIALREWLLDARPVMTDDQCRRLFELAEAVPERDSIVHGDFHIKNVMVQGDECLLIDMETLSHGDALFDLEPTYTAYVGRGFVDPKSIEHFLGLPYELTQELWDLTLRGCLGSDDADALAHVQDRVSLVSALRMLGHPIRNGYAESDLAKRVFATYGEILAEVLPRVDSLSLG